MTAVTRNMTLEATNARMEDLATKMTTMELQAVQQAQNQAKFEQTVEKRFEQLFTLLSDKMEQQKGKEQMGENSNSRIAKQLEFQGHGPEHTEDEEQQQWFGQQQNYYHQPYNPNQEHIIRTGRGSVSVIVYGDQDKPALITYPDLALNHMSCFQGLFFCPEAASLLLHNFCVYHISPPGHELGAAAFCPDDPVPCVDDLTDQILEVLNYFGLGAVMCMGVMAGAYILTLFAIKYRERVLGLILVSPLCRAPSWSEWLCNKVMSNLLYFYGMCGLLKECLLYRYFSKEVRGSPEVPESDIVQSCRRLLDERQSINVLHFLQAIDRRANITEGLKRLNCRTLIFVGENSPFHSDSLHMTAKLDRRYSALVEVQACGSMVTEEQPEAMLIPMEYFLMGYGLHRPCHVSDSPRSPLSPSSISPHLLSPESMGLKLKPIKTRVNNSSNNNNNSDR